MKSVCFCKSAISLVLVVCLQAQAAAVFAAGTAGSAGSADARTTRTDSPVVRTVTPRVRSREEVHHARSAHGRARLDHSVNKISSMGMKVPTGATVSHLKELLLSRADKNSQFQSIVITAGHDESKRGTEHQVSGRKPDSGSGRQERKERREEGASKDSLKSGLFSRVRHHRKVDDLQLTGNQGIGDGSNVSVASNATIAELKEGNIRTMILHQGTVFVAHDKPVQIDTERGQVKIAPHAAVYVVSIGKSVSVYNIADNKTSDVEVLTPGKRELFVKAGEQLLLAPKENSEFEKANPVPEIKASHTKELGTELETKIFNAEFSPVAALDHAEGFHQLVNSTKKEDKALADHILKMAAIVLNLRAADQ